MYFNKKNKKFKRKIHKCYATKDFQNGGDVGVCYITEFTKKYYSKILNLTPLPFKKNQFSLVSSE
jgi:hypothetical protein